MRRLLLLLLLMTLAVGPLRAQAPSIAEIAQGTFTVSTIVEIAERTGRLSRLAGGTHTFFAPVDGGFQTLLDDLDVTLEELLSDELLMAQIIDYHIVPGRIGTGDVLTRAELPFSARTLGGQRLSIGVDNARNVALDDGHATVIHPNIDARNGTMHIIDNVLLPPTQRAQVAVDEGFFEPSLELPSQSEEADFDILTLLNERGLTTFAASAQRTGLADTLRGPGPWTVFVPTNGAFGTVAGELGVPVEALLQDTERLRPILRYHVLQGSLAQQTIVDAPELPLQPLTLQGNRLRVGYVESQFRVVFNNGRASLETGDLVATNGIVHIIDNVLLP